MRLLPLMVLLSMLFYVPALFANCGLVVERAMNFGLYNVAQKNPLHSVLFLKVTCAQGNVGHYKIALSRGKGRSYTPRRMRGEQGAIYYNLYLDPARSVVWGNGRRGTVLVEGNGPCTDLKPCRHVIYGKVTGSSNKLSAEHYVDTIRAVLFYDEISNPQ